MYRTIRRNSKELKALLANPAAVVTVYSGMHLTPIEEQVPVEKLIADLNYHRDMRISYDGERDIYTFYHHYKFFYTVKVAA